MFAPADGRGNAPHATREQADNEGRRLNAKRYETVEQAERALDRRLTQTHLGDANLPPPTQSNVVGAAIALGALGLLLWAASSRSKRNSEDVINMDESESDIVELPEPPAAPTTPVTLNVTVSPQLSAGEPKVLVTNPTPPPLAPEKPKRRRTKKASTPPPPTPSPTTEV
jgi:hypothetical protein